MGSAAFIHTLLDGESGLVAGRYRLEAGVGIDDLDSTALASNAIPTQVCLGAFEVLRIGVWFNPLEASGVRYLLMGEGLPDRSIDSDDDGLPDGAELAAGTSPVDADTDGDGVPDASDPDPPDVLEDGAAKDALLAELMPAGG